MKRVLQLLSVAAFAALGAMAQDEPVVRVDLEARGDYQRDYVDGEAIRDDSGFKGQYLNLRVRGEIVGHWAYDFRHRLNKTNFDSNFFDATDWLYVNYSPNEHWTLSGGKQVVGIGGWEYDRAPIDLYFCSEFWNQVPCYQWGASVTHNFGSDALMFQFCQSPFDSYYTNSDMYAYNLVWSGKHGVWRPLWSANMMEWSQGRFINYLALGNAFDLGKWTIELDLMNRASNHQKFLLRDWSVMGEIAYRPCRAIKLYSHASYDQNNSGNNADLLVHDGTEITRVGAGVEYYPVKKFDIRLHAFYCYSWGTNTNPTGITQDRQSLFSVGATWKIKVFEKK